MLCSFGSPSDIKLDFPATTHGATYVMHGTTAASDIEFSGVEGCLLGVLHPEFDLIDLTKRGYGASLVG